jgi:hypothetical protein
MEYRRREKENEGGGISLAPIVPKSLKDSTIPHTLARIGADKI